MCVRERECRSASAHIRPSSGTGSFAGCAKIGRASRCLGRTSSTAQTLHRATGAPKRTTQIWQPFREFACGELCGKSRHASNLSGKLRPKTVLSHFSLLNKFVFYLLHARSVRAHLGPTSKSPHFARFGCVHMRNVHQRRNKFQMSGVVSILFRLRST